MSQISLDFPQHKNGNGHHGRRERDFASDLTAWLADLEAAEDLRREQLRKLTALRAQIYRLAKARGFTPTMLRATRKLLRK
jgi:hypothetical protein